MRLPTTCSASSWPYSSLTPQSLVARSWPPPPQPTIPASSIAAAAMEAAERTRPIYRRDGDRRRTYTSRMRERFPASGGMAFARLALVSAALFAAAATGAIGAPEKHIPHPHALSPRGQDVETFQLAGNRRGDAAAVWVEFAGPDTEMWLRSRRHGESFGKPERLASGDVAGISPVVAVGDDGTEVAAWVELRGEHGRVFAATRGPDGRLDRRRMLGGGVEPDAGLAAAVAPDGTALVAWSSRRHRRPRQLRAAIRRPQGDWSHPQTLTSGKWSVVNPSAAFDAAGNATLVWER